MIAPTNDTPQFEEFERLVALVASKPDAKELDQHIQAAREELSRRAYLWTYVSKHAAVGMSIEHGSEPSRRAPSFFSLTKYYLVVLCVVGGAFACAALSTTIGVLLGGTGFAALVGWQLFNNSKRAAMLDANRCLRCGYDLKFLAPVVDPRAVAGLGLGPARCPECGRAWPVIPLRDGAA